MAKVVRAIVRRDDNGNYRSFPIGVDISNINVDVPIHNAEDVVIEGGTPLTQAFANIINFINSKSLDNWVYQTTQGDDSTDFLAHKANNGTTWKNTGDIILYPKQGGATFGTTSRGGDSESYEVSTILETKQPNSLEIGISNSAQNPVSGTAANSVVIGEGNTTQNSNTLLVGKNLHATRDNQIVVGEVNQDAEILMPLYDNTKIQSAHSIKDLQITDGSDEVNLSYSKDAIFVVGAGANNNEGDTAIVNAFEIYDNPNKTLDSATGKIPNSLVHTSGNLMVDGDSILNTTYSREKMFVNDLYILGNLWTDTDEETENIVVSAADYKKIINVAEAYKDHTHMVNTVLNVSKAENKVTKYVEKGRFGNFGAYSFNKNTVIGNVGSYAITSKSSNIGTPSSTIFKIAPAYGNIFGAGTNTIKAYYKKSKTADKSITLTRLYNRLSPIAITYSTWIDTVNNVMNFSIDMTVGGKAYGMYIGAGAWTIGSFDTNIVSLDTGNTRVACNVASYGFTGSKNDWTAYIQGNSLVLSIPTAYSEVYGNNSSFGFGTSKKTNNSGLGLSKSNAGSYTSATLLSKCASASKTLVISGSIPISKLSRGEDRYLLDSDKIIFNVESEKTPQRAEDEQATQGTQES